jgi:hypothetical protein
LPLETPCQSRAQRYPTTRAGGRDDRGRVPVTGDRLEVFVCCLYAEAQSRRIRSEIHGSAPRFETEGSEVRTSHPDQVPREC